MAFQQWDRTVNAQSPMFIQCMCLHVCQLPLAECGEGRALVNGEERRLVVGRGGTMTLN